jgi:hypothetical protein
MGIPMQQSDKESGQNSARLVPPLLRTALVLGVLIHLAGFVVFQILTKPLPEAADASPMVEYLSEQAFSGEVELEEQAILFDSAPLFVPTRWSASAELYSSPDSVRWVFPEYEPRIELLEDLEPVALVVDTPYVMNRPEDILDSRYWDFFASFAHGGESPVELPRSAPIAEVRRLSEPGEALRFVPLTIASVGLLPESPALFYVRVDASGQFVSRPRLVESSGQADFDQAVRGWLQGASLAGSLPAGFLSVRVFP